MNEFVCAITTRHGFVWLRVKRRFYTHKVAKRGRATEASFDQNRKRQGHGAIRRAEEAVWGLDPISKSCEIRLALEVNTHGALV